MLAAAPLESSLAVAAPELTAVGEISGRVYQMDSNGATPGIAAVELRLLDDVGSVVRATRTAADGSYAFGGLAAGLYAVQQLQPAGYADGPERVGAAGGQVLTDDLLGEIALTAGQVSAGYDFAEYLPVDAPAPEATGLPRLILAGGGLAGPGLATGGAASLAIGTLMPGESLALAAWGGRSQAAAERLSTAGESQVRADEAVYDTQGEGARANSTAGANAVVGEERPELSDPLPAPTDEWDAAHEELAREQDEQSDPHAQDAVAPVSATIRRQRRAPAAEDHAEAARHDAPVEAGATAPIPSPGPPVARQARQPTTTDETAA